MDARQQWAIVRRAMDALPDPPYYLTSQSTPDGGRAGVVMELSDRKQTATLLVANSHRIASAAEIEQMRAAEVAAVKHYAEIEMKNKQHFAMPPGMEKVIETAAEIVRQQGEKKKENT